MSLAYPNPGRFSRLWGLGLACSHFIAAVHLPKYCIYPLDSRRHLHCDVGLVAGHPSCLDTVAALEPGSVCRRLPVKHRDQSAVEEDLPPTIVLSAADDS